MGYKVLQYWEHGVGWRWHLLDQHFTNSSMVKLVYVALTPDTSLFDEFVWLDGRKSFIVKEAYRLTRDRSVGDN